MKKEIIVTAKQFRTESDFPLVAEDANAYEVVFYAEEDITDGCMAVTALRADGQKQTCSAKPSGNIARCLLTKNMYSVPGELVLRVTVTDGAGTEITTNEILFNVLSPSMESISEEPETVNTLLSLLSQVDNTLEDAKFITTIAANAADLAETKGFYANEMGQNAEKAAKMAQDAAEKAETEAAVAEIMTDFISKKAGQLPPSFSESDEGKILYLSRNENASELRNYSDTFDSSNFEGTFLDAGMSDSSTCYIDISAPALYSNGILNPLDEGCMFGFTFIPDYSEYDSDYDVIIDSVEETDGGYRMFFGAESCPPFTENVTDDDSLFSAFEQIRFNAEFPEAKVTGKWGTPEEVIPSGFIDSNIISPALQLSKEYTDTSLDEAIYSIEKVLHTAEYPDFTVELTVPDDAVGIKNITIGHPLEYGPNADTAIYFYAENGSLIYSDYLRITGPLNFVMDVRDNADNPIKRIWIDNVEADFFITKIEYYKMEKVEKYKYYADTAIENAIVKSWGEAV